MAVEAEQIDDEALTGVKDLRGSFIFVLHRFSISLVESLSLTLFEFEIRYFLFYTFGMWWRIELEV